VDVASKKKTTPRERIAQLVRLFGTPKRGERANAWRALERTMESVGVTWSDIGNWIEHGDGKYTEEEMLEMVAAIRKEERARAPQSNGHIVLPEPLQMAEYCNARPGRLKSDWQREFIADIYRITQRGMNLSLPRLANLAKIYIEMGGRRT
jgi:hypothetical protein